MGEQLPITWSPLVTGRYLHGPGLSRMADNSGHEALAPDSRRLGGTALTGVVAALHALSVEGVGGDMALYRYCFISPHLLHTLYGFPYCHCQGWQMFEVILFW